MRPNFATGILVGILLASALVVGSSFSGGQAILTPSASTQTITGFATSSTSTFTVSRSNATLSTSPSPLFTVATTTSTASTTQPAAAGSSNAPSASTTSGLSAGGLVSTVSGGVTQAQAAASSTGQAPSSLAVLIKQPSDLPILLLPVLFALALGFALFWATKEKD